MKKLFALFAALILSTSLHAGVIHHDLDNDWLKLANVSNQGHVTNEDIPNFWMDFTADPSGKFGTWTITNRTANDVFMDILMGIQAGNASKSYTLDNQFIAAGETITSTWNVSKGYTKVEFFERDVQWVLTVPTPPAQTVAEPVTIGMMLLGLTLIAAVIYYNRK